jgi:hypothetical protein
MHRNQHKFQHVMANILGGMLGPGKQQIGAATFHLQYAYHEKDDVLQSGA